MAKTQQNRVKAAIKREQSDACIDSAERKQTRRANVKITRQLLTKALVWLCPRYTRQGGKGEPAWACSHFDGTFSNCVGLCEQCSQITDVYRTMVKIGNGEIEVL